jgi:dUTPase
MTNASLDVDAQEVNELPKTDRGASGFGSSGV